MYNVRFKRYKKSCMQSSHVTRFKHVYTALQFQSLLAMITQSQCLYLCQSGHKSKCPWFLQLSGILDILDYPARDIRLGWARKWVWEGLDMTEPSFSSPCFAWIVVASAMIRCSRWPRLLRTAKPYSSHHYKLRSSDDHWLPCQLVIHRDQRMVRPQGKHCLAADVDIMFRSMHHKHTARILHKICQLHSQPIPRTDYANLTFLSFSSWKTSHQLRD